MMRKSEKNGLCNIFDVDVIASDRNGWWQDNKKEDKKRFSIKDNKKSIKDIGIF